MQRYFLFVPFFVASLSSYAMNLVQEQPAQNASKIKPMLSLRQSCFAAVIKQEPEKAKALLKQTTIPEELQYAFACEVAQKAPVDFVVCVADVLPTTAYPDMALAVVTGARSIHIKHDDGNKTKEENKKILERLLEVSAAKKDRNSCEVIQEMKDFYSVSNAGNIPLRVLFYGSMFGDFCSLTRFLLHKFELKQYKLERLLNIPQYDLDMPGFEKGKFNQLIDSFEKLIEEKKLDAHNVKVMIEKEGREKGIYICSVSSAYVSILFRMHKLLYLGIRPAPEGFEYHNRYQFKEDRLLRYCFAERKSCLDLIMYSLKKLNSDSNLIFDYSSLRSRLDGNNYLRENLACLRQVKDFYKNQDNRKQVGCLGMVITDERYRQDIDFFYRLAELKFNFYCSALKLLLPCCNDEFEAKKAKLAKIIRIPVEHVEAYINQHALIYNAAIERQAEWEKAKEV